MDGSFVDCAYRREGEEGWYVVVCRGGRQGSGGSQHWDREASEMGWERIGDWYSSLVNY